LLKEKLKIQISLPKDLFNKEISDNPAGFQHIFSFPVLNPKGTFLIKLQNGSVKGVQSVIWELQFISTFQNSMKDEKDFSEWLIDAHRIIEDSFFTLIEGDLLRSFENG
ncbi:MAG TPA: TIGR04255 family protein, partial [Leptospiraceae bacterium]|nr:TIGR04255 family protein [Leptospiraceae bacterium]